jgi:hypothetical protein
MATTSPHDGEAGTVQDEDVETPQVLARTMPAPPMDERTRLEQDDRKRFAIQCIGVLVIGAALYWCFGASINRLVSKLFGLRRTSWLPECLTCGVTFLLPLIPIVWRYVRQKTQTPRG